MIDLTRNYGYRASSNQFNLSSFPIFLSLLV